MSPRIFARINKDGKTGTASLANISFSENPGTILIVFLAVTEYNQQTCAWTATYSSPTKFLCARQELSRFHKLHYADGPLKGRYVNEGRTNPQSAHVPDASVEVGRYYQRHAKRRRPHEEEAYEAEQKILGKKHLSQVLQSSDGCIFLPNDCSISVSDVASDGCETIVGKTDSASGGSGFETAVALGGSYVTDRNLGTSHSALKSEIIEQENNLFALGAIMPGKYLVERLRQSNKTVWSASDRLPEKQEIRNNNAAQNDGNVGTHEPEIAGRAANKNAHLISQGSEAISEMASQLRWWRTVQDLRAASGTVAWNMALVLICVEYLFSTYASKLEQELLPDAGVEASVNQTALYSADVGDPLNTSTAFSFVLGSYGFSCPSRSSTAAAYRFPAAHSKPPVFRAGELNHATPAAVLMGLLVMHTRSFTRVF